MICFCGTCSLIQPLLVSCSDFRYHLSELCCLGSNGWSCTTSRSWRLIGNLQSCSGRIWVCWFLSASCWSHLLCSPGLTSIFVSLWRTLSSVLSVSSLDCLLSPQDLAVGRSRYEADIEDSLFVDLSLSSGAWLSCWRCFYFFQSSS